MYHFLSGKASLINLQKIMSYNIPVIKNEVLELREEDEMAVPFTPL